MLKIRYTDDRKPAFWALEKNYSIGRAHSNQLCVNDADVDEVHARIVQRGEHYLLKDANSRLGTYVNGTRITQRNICCGDVLRFGQTEFEIIDPLDTLAERKIRWALIADSSWLTGHEFPLRLDTNNERKTVTLGRSSECDIVIPGTHLSRKHAEIRLKPVDGQESNLLIRDMESANGTFVNGKKVDESALHPGDRIRLDVYSFRVFGPGINLPKAATQTQPVITEEILKEREPSIKPEEKLWKTRSTSPGNRTQKNLYPKKWLSGATAVLLLCLFLGGFLYYLFGQ